MDYKTADFPDHHQLPELTQTHIPRVDDDIHTTITSSVIPFSSCLQSFPTSGSFPVSQFVASGGHSIGVSASVSVLSMTIHDWFPLRVTGLISLQFKGLSSVSSNTKVQKTPILQCSAFFRAQLSHPYMTTGKTIALTRLTFVSKATSLYFNMSGHSFSSKSKHVFKFHGCSHHLQWFWTPQK